MVRICKINHLIQTLISTYPNTHTVAHTDTHTFQIFTALQTPYTLTHTYRLTHTHTHSHTSNTHSSACPVKGAVSSFCSSKKKLLLFQTTLRFVEFGVCFLVYWHSNEYAE